MSAYVFYTNIACLIRNDSELDRHISLCHPWSSLASPAWDGYRWRGDYNIVLNVLDLPNTSELELTRDRTLFELRVGL